MATHSHHRDTAGNEQWVIDRLIEAVHEGNADEKVTLAERLLDGFASRDWESRRIVESGLVVPNAVLDGSDADLDELAEALGRRGIGKRRISQISKGAKLRPDELWIWAKYLRERLEASGGDPSGHTECVAFEITHSDHRRRAYVAVTNWRNGSGAFVAAYATCPEVVRALNDIGVVRMDDQRVIEDYRRRR